MGASLIPIAYAGSLFPTEGRFTVQSVFASAVNLSAVHSLYPFALLSCPAHRHPSSAVPAVPIRDFRAWGLRTGSAAVLERGRLDFEAEGVPAFDFVGAVPFDETMPTLAVPDLAEALSFLTRRQLSAGAELNLMGLDSPSSPLERRLAGAVALLPHHFEEGARLLVGLGSGLTPSGDDFLVGWMAAERALGRVSSGLDGLKSGTNLISAGFLDAAERGLFPASLVGLAQALAGRGSLAEALDALAQIGHSSGLDAAAGLLIGLLKLPLSEVHP